MSAPSVPGRGIDPNLPSVPLWREITVEMRKAVGTRGPWLLLGLLGLIWLVIAGVLLGGESPSFAGGMDGFSSMTRIFVAILAILLVTSEWGQRSVVTAFTLEPRRERVIAAKLAAVLLGVAGLFAAALVLAAVITAVCGGSFDGAAESLKSNGIRALFDILMAFAMGLAILNTAGAIVAYLALPDVVVPALLFLASFSTGGIGGDGDGLESTTLFATVGPWVYPQEAFSSIQGTGAGALGWAHVLVCAVIWIGIPGLLGVYRVMTSEVK